MSARAVSALRTPTGVFLVLYGTVLLVGQLRMMWLADRLAS